MLIKNNKLIEIGPEDVIDGVFTAPDDVLYISSGLHCNTVVKMVLPNVIEIGSGFLYSNTKLEYLYLPKLERIGNDFLYWNTIIESIYMPNIKEIGPWFLFKNAKFQYTPRIIKALKGSLYINYTLIDKNEYLRKLNIKKILL